MTRNWVNKLKGALKSCALAREHGELLSNWLCTVVQKWEQMQSLRFFLGVLV